MTNPINLNQARKARAKSRAKQKANENAVKFGRTKVQRAQDQATLNRAKDAQDAAKLTKPDD